MSDLDEEIYAEDVGEACDKRNTRDHLDPQMGGISMQTPETRVFKHRVSRTNARKYKKIKAM